MRETENRENRRRSVSSLQVTMVVAMVAAKLWQGGPTHYALHTTQFGVRRSA